MGNCLWGGPAETVIKVIKSNGGIMEFFPPIAVNSITNEFPGHAIFPNNIIFSKPLCQFDELVAGQSYHLLPLQNQPNYNNYSSSSFVDQRQAGHVRSQSVPTILPPHPAVLPPYRMTSLDYQYYQGVGLLKRSTTTEESFSCRSTSSSNSTRSNYRRRRRRSIGIWKVKLVITPEKLVEILSQEACTKELVESVRIVAKCGVAAAAAAAAGNINSSVSTTTLSDDQWSLSSSCTSAPSKIDHALIIS